MLNMLKAVLYIKRNYHAEGPSVPLFAKACITSKIIITPFIKEWGYMITFHHLIVKEFFIMSLIHTISLFNNTIHSLTLIMTSNITLVFNKLKIS